MKQKKNIFLFIGLIIFIFFVVLLVFFILIPTNKFNKEYTPPHNMTAKETIEKYFEYIEDRNPAQANSLCTTPFLDAYSCNTISTAKVNSITETGDCTRYTNYNKFYSCKEYFVDFECKYFLNIWQDSAFGTAEGEMFFCLVKETEDSDWKIADMYTGP